LTVLFDLPRDSFSSKPATVVIQFGVKL